MKKRIALLTGGGDCPGLNAVIRAVTKTAAATLGWEVFGYKDGYLGLIENRWVALDERAASGIITRGGTILGTSNKGNPFEYYAPGTSQPIDASEQAVRNFNSLNLDALITIGGDGTQAIANQLIEKGIPIVGVPKTIDNDLGGTDQTFGFDTAVEIATEAIDRIHTTAQAHHRIMLVEVMGRYAGWIALHSGLAAGGDIILLPEFRYSLDKVVQKIHQRQASGRTFTIIVVSEGAREEGKDYTVNRIVKESHDPIRLGGIAYVLAKELEDATGIETRATVLGHVQRGGTPVATDRVLATRYGNGAVDLISQGKFGQLVSLRNGEIVGIPIAEAIAKPRLVTREHPLVRLGEETGVSFGV